MSERERIDRLVKDGKVAGYQKQEGGKIWHQSEQYPYWWPITDPTRENHYISHDRIDEYTGFDIDGVKVFERDMGVVGGEAFTVKFINGSWSMITRRPRVDFIQDLYRNIKHARITGIEGVTS